QVKERGVHLEFTERAKAVLAERGYDPDFGGRPLRRAIQRLVENPLSEEILKGSFGEGDRIVVDADDGGEIVFHKKEMAEAAKWTGEWHAPRGEGAVFRSFPTLFSARSAAGLLADLHQEVGAQVDGREPHQAAHHG